MCEDVEVGREPGPSAALEEVVSGWNLAGGWWDMVRWAGKVKGTLSRTLVFTLCPLLQEQQEEGFFSDIS